MSNEQSSNRSATPPERNTPDVLPAELSAGAPTGDPRDHEWARGTEMPPSEAAYVPPMPIQSKDMDTWDLAEAIGLETARIARYASSRNSTVIIDGGRAGDEPQVDIDMDDEGAPTEKMPVTPVAKQDIGAVRGAPSDSGRITTLTGLIVAGAGLFLCAIYFLARPGADSALSAQSVLAAAPPIVSKTLHEAASTCPPCKTSDAPQRGIPTCALERAAAPSRAASPLGKVSSKSVSIDPLFTLNPGY
jgi:hypothetical protein